jgi:hypothetical protein
MTFQLGGVARGLFLHLAARFRRRFLRPDAPVFTLGQEIDYARFCASIGEIPEDPIRARMMETLHEGWDELPPSG